MTKQLIGSDPELTEKKMFGGLAFLIRGNMAIAASSEGGAMVRVDPAQSDALVATTKATLMNMRGPDMPGWLRSVPTICAPTTSSPPGWRSALGTRAPCRPNRRPPERRSTAVQSRRLDHLDAQVCSRRPSDLMVAETVGSCRLQDHLRTVRPAEVNGRGLSCARDAEALPARLRHSAGCCH